MTSDEEWYVISEGYGTIWKPRKVIQGRVTALSHLTEGMKPTPAEMRALHDFVESPPSKDPIQILLVGELQPFSHGTDRTLTRVPAPWNG